MKRITSKLAGRAHEPRIPAQATRLEGHRSPEDVREARARYARHPRYYV